MNLDAVIAGTIPSLLLAAVGWHMNRVQKDRDALAESQAKKITELEAHVKQDIAEHHQLDVRLAKAETAADGAREAMASLRELIEQQFASLNQRIDDVLRRFNPPPR